MNADLKVGRNPLYRHLMQDPKGKSRGRGLASLLRQRDGHRGQARQEGRVVGNEIRGQQGI